MSAGVGHASTVTQRPSRAALEASTSVPQRPRGKSRITKKSLTDWHNLPGWLRDNEFITNHYRVDWSAWDSFKSLFKVHNETGNIWTHLIGFLIFVVLTVVTVYLRPAPLTVGKDLVLRVEATLLDLGRSSMHELYELEQRLVRAGASGLAEFQTTARELLDLQKAMNALGIESLRDFEATKMLQYGKDNLGALGGELAALEARVTEYARSNWQALKSVAHVLEMGWPVSRWPVHVFTGGAMICLLTSTLCHLFGCCSAHVAKYIWRIDYAGISVLIVTSFYPPVYYGFMCHPNLQFFYLASTTAMGVCVLIASLVEVFQSTHFRPIRAGLYAGLGLWGLVPLFHGCILYWDVKDVVTAMLLDVLMGAVYLLGAAIYALRVPERWMPGAFDLAFHSHQLFHVAVVVGAGIHYKAVLIFLRWRDAHACPLDPTILH